MAAARPVGASLPAMRLEAFDPRFADVVASWVRSDTEAYHLCPRSQPPITAAAVRGWVVTDDDRRAHQLAPLGRAEPLAYGELNLLSAERREYWLGHLIAAPEWRGRGVGVELVRLLAARAFVRCGARCVSLVVFPDNDAAIRCYRRAGFSDDGFESHRFPPDFRAGDLRRMVLERLT